MTEALLITVTVNGTAYERIVPVRWTVADFLRDELELTGTHLACEHGVCGACTVLVDGVAVRSCIMYAPQLDGREVVTVEGLAGTDGQLSPLQRAFVARGALQCGFCTPGFLMAAHALLLENADPDEAEIRDAVGGNLCRCTSYSEIVAAVADAATARRAGQDGGRA